ncbi:MAG: hypothetical protein P8M18_05545, partial [Woeseiaceae bacterium]|nr:hypothetical protein [Woeseiaceae bacterium]
MALLGEMRRRNIFKVSLAYAIVSWLIVQVADILLPLFNAPQWIVQTLVLMLILFFPISALLSWAYELTPEGFKATADVDRTQSITVKTGKKLNHVVIVLLSLAALFLGLDNYVFQAEIQPTPDVAYRQSIAVLPFTNRSEAEESAEFFTDGVHDGLLTRLAHISDLHVISHTSVMSYRGTTLKLREIGAELGVGSILEGSVQRDSDAIRINVQLIDAQTDERIWADTYERALNAANVFALQSEISATIAGALEANLSDAEQARLEMVSTENLDALDAYFVGKLRVANRTEPSLRKAIEAFGRATELDPQFAAAWAGLAEAWLELPGRSTNTDPQRIRRRASSAAIRAINLSPELSDAQAALGWHLLLHNYDWQGAEAAFRRALHIEPTNINALHWYSRLLSWQAKHTDAIAAARFALSTDPLSPLTRINMSYILMDAKAWDEALNVADGLMSQGIYPSLLVNTWVGTLRSARTDVSTDMLTQWAAATARDPEAAAVVNALVMRRQSEDVPVSIDHALIDRLMISNELAELQAALGNADATLDALEATLQSGTGSSSLLSMKINPS